MIINPREVAGCELIGTTIKVVKSSNKDLIGVEGKVVDETKNTLTIEKKNKEKKLIKDQIVFEMKYKNQRFQIDGKILVARPEDRLKLKLK
ncbi:ribonuclease P protein subunit [Candidatus Woesearchaeota archaeon]|nr:ribonuclease P protein subunit [Candidatus Woesearchaeota archaeon]